MQRAQKIRKPMNLKLTYQLNLFPTKSLTTVEHDIIHNKNNSVEAQGVCRCLNSQSLTAAERVDHQHLLSPSVGVWEKIHLYGWHRSDPFLPHSGSERVKRHRILSMKVPVSFTHLLNHLLK
ncbi:UNVERIFIED_CONTAM: hypothetical protein NCL1_41831 [Trichonephila clavipes]